MRVITISRDDVIVITDGCDRAGHNRFLADVKMTKPSDFLRLILLAGAFLKPPDQQHQREHLDFVALLYRPHGGHAVRGTASPARARSVLRPNVLQRIKNKVKTRSLRSELRKNIQLGVAL